MTSKERIEAEDARIRAKQERIKAAAEVKADKPKAAKKESK